MRLDSAVLLLLFWVSVSGAVELKSYVMGNGGGRLSGGTLGAGAVMGQPIQGMAESGELWVKGGWLWTLASMMTIEEGQNGGAPEKFELLPSGNIFSGASMVKFTLPRAGAVEFMVFDAAGRLVHHEIRQFTPGRHVFKWDAASSPSGVYIYRLKALGKVINQKVVKIK